MLTFCGITHKLSLFGTCIIYSERLEHRHNTGWAKKCDTSRTLHYIVREVSLFWLT